MKIRRAKKKDIDGILKLLRQIAELHHQGRPDVFKTGVRKFSRKELKQKIKIDKDDMNPVFVAVEADTVLGYCFCEWWVTVDDGVMEDRTMLWIEDFCVDESLRGQGIGKKIFAHVEQFAREHSGAHGIKLNVWAFNEGAVNFYKNFGFKVSSRVMEMVFKPSISKGEDIT